MSDPSPSARAGAAFRERLASDPDLEAAVARLRAAWDAIGPELVEVIREAVDLTDDELAAVNATPPGLDLDRWFILARVVGVDPGPLTLDEIRIEVLAFYERTKIEQHARGGEPRVEAGKPSQDRQGDIIAAIRSREVPLEGDEIADAIGCPRGAAIRRQLKWMTDHDLLAHVHRRGYWPASDPPPV